jgi:prepilin-type N-terminal cleavage/methylation domain-containing protein
VHVIRRIRTRLAAEDGFTLPELLIAIAIGSIIIVAAYGLLDASRSGAMKVTDRVDSTQRGRLAMDEVVRQLRSQVCIDPAEGAILDGRDESVTFYSFTGTGTYAPERHTIAWDADARTIVDYTYVGEGTPPNMTFPATPTRSRLLLTEVVRLSDQPIFTYFSWTTDGTARATRQLATPMSATDARQTVRVLVQFRVLPTRTGQSSESTALVDEVFSRTADPNGNNGPTPTQCV